MEMSGASIHSLPDDLVLKILRGVSRTARNSNEILSPLMTCKKWKRLCLSTDFLRDMSREALCISTSQWENGARKFLQLAVDAGSLEATYILGMILFYCLPSERTNGARLIVRAARAGHAAALYATAVITFNGSGCSRQAKDLKMGVALCARAAALGNVEGLRELGHCLLDGFGVKQDQAEGWRLLLLAYFQELQTKPNKEVSRLNSLVCISNSNESSKASGSCDINHTNLDVDSHIKSIYGCVNSSGMDSDSANCLHPNKRQRSSQTAYVPIHSSSSSSTTPPDLFGNFRTMPPQQQQAALHELLNKRKVSVLQPPFMRLDTAQRTAIDSNSVSAFERFGNGGGPSPGPRTPPSLGIGTDRRVRAVVRPNCPNLSASVEDAFLDASLRVVRSSRGRLMLVNQRRPANVTSSNSLSNSSLLPNAVVVPLPSAFPLPHESQATSVEGVGFRSLPNEFLSGSASLGEAAIASATQDSAPSEAKTSSMDRINIHQLFSAIQDPTPSLHQALSGSSASLQKQFESNGEKDASSPTLLEDLTTNQQIMLYIIRMIGIGLVPQPVNKKVKMVLSLLQTSCLPKPSHPVHTFLVEFKQKQLEMLNSGLEMGADVHYCGRLSCGRPETRPLEFWRCSCCWSARYCSRSCQLYDWRVRHSHECKPSPHIRQHWNQG